ncbi:hypothetical protein KR222_009406, partial [Zaprionus bogoriensis]
TILQLLIAAAAAAVAFAMLGLCAADVSHINHELPKDIVVPFNDLLPPPLEESTTEAPRAAAAAATKPTKKSYYQQQARSKDVQQAQVQPVAEKSVPLLALDLLPPFEEAATSDALQPQVEGIKGTTTQRPTTIATTARATVPVHVVRPQVLHARVARPNSIATEASASSTASIKSRLTPELVAQYASYFQFTTPRPPRGPLPTLTPFPRHIRK